MAQSPLFGIPMDGGPQSFDGVDPSSLSQSSVAQPTSPHHSGFQNILGFLGDLLMSRLHMGTPYHDARENEKLNAARLADEQDPSGSYANVGNINTPLAIKLAENRTDNERLRALQQSTLEARKQREEIKREGIRKDVITRAAGYFNALDPNDPNIQETYKRGRDLWSHSQVVSSDPELQAQLEDMFPEQYDPALIHSSIGSTVTPSKQWDQAITVDKNTKADERAGQRIDVTKRGQDISHNDRMTSIEHADSRSAARNATSSANTRARIAAKGTKPVKAVPTAEDISYLRANPNLRDKFDGKFGLGKSKIILGN